MDRYQKPSSRRSGRYRRKAASEWPHIFLFYILPFFVFNGILLLLVISKPRVTLAVGDSTDYLSCQVTLTVDSWFPTKTVELQMDGETLELTKGPKRTYTASVSRNGMAEAYVVNLNGMPVQVFRQVNVLDDTLPHFESASVDDGILTVVLSDTQSGINYDSIYGLNSEGGQVLPLTVNQETGTLTFTMDPEGLQIFVQDKAGNESRCNYTSHMEGTQDVLNSFAEDDSTAEQ
ncbi:MAG: hypothetical protein Q4C73_02000 [Eubacteriales bacterium]|nr:hypothetical protein [Eubacteriales bacterium]